MRFRSTCAAALIALLLLLVAGCGGGSSNKLADPRAEALSYMPRNSPAIVEVGTDPGSAQITTALGLVRRFPFGGELLTELKGGVERQGVDFEQDIRPLLGNPIAFSTLQGPGGTGFVGAIVVNDPARLATLVKRHGSKLEDRQGFSIYDRAGTDGVRAIKGTVFVVAGDKATLEAAIDRHAHGQGARAGDVDALDAGLPAQPLLRVSGQVGALIARAATTQANRVPFVRAIKGYAATLSASAGGLALDVRVDTSGATLAPDDRPLAAGAHPPPLGSGAAIDVAALDPAHAVRFLIGIGRALDPTGYAGFTAELAVVKARSGVDVLAELDSQLSGPAQVAASAASFSVRATARNPSLLRRDLLRLSPLLRRLGSARTVPGPHGMTLVRSGGRTLFEYGVLGDQFVLGTAAPARVAGFAGEPLAALPGARGTVAARVSLKTLPVTALFEGGPGSPTAQIFRRELDRLGDVTGYASEDAKAITAHFGLRVR